MTRMTAALRGMEVMERTMNNMVLSQTENTINHGRFRDGKNHNFIVRSLMESTINLWSLPRRKTPWFLWSFP